MQSLMTSARFVSREIDKCTCVLSCTLVCCEHSKIYKIDDLRKFSVNIREPI